MLNDKKIDLCKYRLDVANERLEMANTLIDLRKYKYSVSQSYYSIFSSVRSILALDEVDFRKHSGVISYFQRQYIKSNLFDKKFSGFLKMAFEIRNDSDYEDFYIVTRERAMKQYCQAKEFLEEVKKYIENRIKEEREN